MPENENPFKLVSKPVYTCDYKKFEKFVESVFGLEDYSLVASEELSNDMVFHFEINDYDKFDSDDEETFTDEVLQGEYMYNTPVITGKLHQIGLLPVGQYYVNISW